ncbi:hypothetical protein Y032_0043g841 [Ancylostoma ceylanicum]|uniref:Uncharacterized protein n=1 Tax=Ancylostoma ceylanicum TaxID=53326 RepID=A0A016UGD2_9BILA|nr:hypothetical protein Y032_0043g841 [Ancylostoma ceylanicum]
MRIRAESESKAHAWCRFGRCTRDKSPGGIREREKFCGCDVILRSKNVTVVQKHCNGESASQKKEIMILDQGSLNVKMAIVAMCAYHTDKNSVEQKPRACGVT